MVRRLGYFIIGLETGSASSLRVLAARGSLDSALYKGLTYRAE